MSFKTPDNVPAKATSVLYRCTNGKHAVYYTWMTDQCTWMWAALSNCGEEPTLDRAREAAKLWIRDSTDIRRVRARQQQ